MSATVWLVIAISGFSLAGIALIVAVFMFIKMNIPSVIGDLTGKTVAREIKAMKEFNNSKGGRRFRPGKVHLEKGTLRETVTASTGGKKIMAEAHASKRLDKTGPTVKKPNKNVQKDSGTVGLNDFQINLTNILNDGNTPTEVLSDNATEFLAAIATEILSESQIEVLAIEDTEVLSETATNDRTTVLSEETMGLDSTEKLEDDSKPVAFQITKNHVITHTDEVI